MARRDPSADAWPPSGRCISLSTFRRDGTAVGAPVWFVPVGGELWVWTNEKTGKVTRLRRDPACRVAPCTVSGRVTGAETSARARFLSEGDAALMPALLRRRYPVQKRALDLMTRLRRAPAPGRSICIALARQSGSPPGSGLPPG